MIGLCYLILSLFCAFLGYIYSLFIRLELSIIGCGVLFGDYQYYNVVITSHGLVMIFAFIMPVFTGAFANYYAPVMIGFPDMLFPRLNNMSFWTFFLGVACVVSGIITEEGIGAGWTFYPTLICIDFHSSLACDFVIFAVHSLGVSSIMNSINIIGTCFCARRKFYSLLFWLLFVWGLMLTSFLLITTLPILAGSVTMLLLDRNFNTSFYDVVGGGDLVMFQHLFWFFGHPEVYIIILPVFGLVSTMVDVIGLRCVFSVIGMIYSMLLISILGFFVWAHHMFVVGMDVDSRAYFGSITILIGLPTAVKLFNWFYSFLFMDMIIVFEIYFIFIFIAMFLIGGITGLFLANVGVDILLHDTYFVVAHFHYVLSLGAVTGFFGGFLHFIYKWIPIEFYLFWMFYIISLLWIGSNLLFLPLHSLGLYGFPRRISDYPISFLYWSALMLTGMLILSILVFFCAAFFCSFLFFDFCYFFVTIFLYCVFCFFYFNDWIPFVMSLYLILFEFMHMILDYLYSILAFCFVFYIFFFFFFSLIFF